MTPLAITVVRDRHDPIALLYLDDILDEPIATDRPDALISALRLAGAALTITEDPVQCPDDCVACRQSDRDERSLSRGDL